MAEEHPERSERARLRERALARWENEGGSIAERVLPNAELDRRAAEMLALLQRAIQLRDS